MQHHIEQWHYCKFFLFKDISVDFCLSARHITAEWLPQWRAEVQHADTGSLVLCMLLWRTEIFCCHFRCTCCLTTSLLYSHHCSQCAHSKILFCLYHHICLVSITLFSHPFSLWVKMYIGEEVRYCTKHDLMQLIPQTVPETAIVLWNGWKRSTTEPLKD